MANLCGQYTFPNTPCCPLLLFYTADFGVSEVGTLVNILENYVIELGDVRECSWSRDFISLADHIFLSGMPSDSQTLVKF